jgi:hypothetical protein
MLARQVLLCLSHVPNLLYKKLFFVTEFHYIALAGLNLLILLLQPFGC